MITTMDHSGLNLDLAKPSATGLCTCSISQWNKAT